MGCEKRLAYASLFLIRNYELNLCTPDKAPLCKGSCPEGAEGLPAACSALPQLPMPPLALPLGELSPQVTERASGAWVAADVEEGEFPRGSNGCASRA